MPSYENQTDQLVTAYRNAVKRIQRELERLDLTNAQRANAKATLAEVARILRDLNEESRKWVEDNVPMAISEGTAEALVSLGVVDTLEEALASVKFNRMNRELVDAVILDTKDDLLQATKNIDKKTKAAVRKAVAEAQREQMAAGINGRRTISHATLEKLRGAIGDAADTGLIDAANRRWRPADYVDMVTRTKLSNAYIDAVANEAVDRGALYGIISSHGATDACRYHEGEIVRLTEAGDKSYPTLDELRASGQIFHPRCRHHVSPIQSLDNLPDSVREKAEKQTELGQKAISTGKRNPKM